MSKIFEEQLKKVEFADLSNFDEATSTYTIKKRVDIKLVEDNCYLIHLKSTFFLNETLKINWNNNSVPLCDYLKADVSKVMGKMAKVVAVYYDNETKTDLGQFWSGWITLDDIEIIQML